MKLLNIILVLTFAFPIHVFGGLNALVDQTTPETGVTPKKWTHNLSS